MTSSLFPPLFEKPPKIGDNLAFALVHARTMHQPSRHPVLIGHLMAVSAMLLWAAVYPLLRTARQELDPVALMLLRSTIFSVAMGTACVFRPPRIRAVGWKGLWLIIPMAIIAGPAYQVMQNFGASNTSSGLMGMIHTTQALHTGWLAAVVLGERFRRIDLLTLGIAFAGISIPILSKGKMGYTGSIIYPGALAIIAVMGSLNNVLARKLMRVVGSWDLVSVVYLLGCVFAIPLMSRGAWEQWRHLSPKGCAAVCYLAIPGSLIPIILVYAALKRLRAATVAFYTFILVIGSTALGTLRGEMIGWIDVLSIAIVLAALVLHVVTRPGPVPVTPMEEV